MHITYEYAICNITNEKNHTSWDVQLVSICVLGTGDYFSSICMLSTQHHRTTFKLLLHFKGGSHHDATSCVISRYNRGKTDIYFFCFSVSFSMARDNRKKWGCESKQFGRSKDTSAKTLDSQQQPYTNAVYGERLNADNGLFFIVKAYVWWSRVQHQKKRSLVSFCFTYELLWDSSTTSCLPG